MNWPRSSGLLLHVTSLAGPFGNGDLGLAAYRFVDFLRQAGQQWWQVLPLVPPALGTSPYTGYSAFAGNPLLVSPHQLAREGWLSDDALADAERSADADAARMTLLASAHETFLSRATDAQREEFAAYQNSQQWWLADYALFAALTEATQGANWNTWSAELVHRQPAALDTARREHAARIDCLEFIQFQFARQWTALKQYAHQHGVRLFGDIPIFVAYESADVWQHQPLFHLDDAGNRLVVAGVPPDYFAATGQLWGNPLYRWDVMADNGYAWWTARLRHALELFDLIRLDHFRGFQAYWEVPGTATTAIDGHWVPGPGAALFQAVRQQLGELPLVAEDLGLITDDVIALRDQLGFPGMRVFQFGFDDDYLGQYHRPHSYPPHSVAYTGTHDNNTSVGWYQAVRDEAAGDRLRVYLSTDGNDIHWRMMHALFESAANTVIVPVQDLLGLDGTARMNVPGVSKGNWTWRVDERALSDEVATRLRELTQTTGRLVN